MLTLVYSFESCTDLATAGNSIFIFQPVVAVLGGNTRALFRAKGKVTDNPLNSNSLNFS